MGMRFNFIKTAYDDLKQIETLEELMEKASDDGWQVHSWQARPDGGITVLMVQPAKATQPDPMSMIPQRSPRIGSTPAAKPQDPDGRELRDGKKFVKPTTPDHSGS